MSILPLYYFNNANINWWFSVLNKNSNSRQLMPRDAIGFFCTGSLIRSKIRPACFRIFRQHWALLLHCMRVCFLFVLFPFFPLPKTWGFSHSQLLFGWINVKARKSIREKYHFFLLLHVKTKYICREDYIYSKSWQPLLISCEFPNISCQEFSLPFAVCVNKGEFENCCIFSSPCPCDECGSCGI